MKSLELAVLLLAWLAFTFLLIGSAPVNQYRQVFWKIKEKKELLSAKTACDVLFLDSDYTQLNFNIRAKIKNGKLAGDFYSEQCASDQVHSSPTGIKVKGERQWFK